jgi:hypothetical protein
MFLRHRNVSQTQECFSDTGMCLTQQKILNTLGRIPSGMLLPLTWTVPAVRLPVETGQKFAPGPGNLDIEHGQISHMCALHIWYVQSNSRSFVFVDTSTLPGLARVRQLLGERRQAHSGAFFNFIFYLETETPVPSAFIFETLVFYALVFC